MFCVDTLGDLVKEWREESGLGLAGLARLINKAAGEDLVTYQNIQQLEAGNKPRYMRWLAKAMGTTVEDLEALKKPPSLKATPSGLAAKAQPTAPPPSSIAADIERIARHMNSVDELTRSMAKPLFDKLLASPQDGPHIAARLEALLRDAFLGPSGSANDARQPESTPPPSTAPNAEPGGDEWTPNFKTTEPARDPGRSGIRKRAEQKAPRGGRKAG
jgi:hypothetical protein